MQLLRLENEICDVVNRHLEAAGVGPEPEPHPRPTSHTSDLFTRPSTVSATEGSGSGLSPQGALDVSSRAAAVQGSEFADMIHLLESPVRRSPRKNLTHRKRILPSATATSSSTLDRPTFD